MPIAPDTKDWTWVLDSRCPECGFDAAAVEFEAIPARTRDAGGRLAAACRQPNSIVRPNESTWSVLEYAAHVRDVCRIFRYRLEVTVSGSGSAPSIPGFDPELRWLDGVPLLSNWDQDHTAVADDYGNQEPSVVAEQVEEAADQMAAYLESVLEADRSNIVRRTDGAQFTVVSLSQYFLHDLVHHVHDVEG